MAQIINITHDAGNITEYTGTVMTASGDTITATTGSAMMSTPYGLQVFTGTVSAGNLTYAYKTFTSITSTEYRWRVYFDPNSQTSTGVTDKYFFIFYHATNNGYTELAYDYTTGSFRIKANVRSDDGVDIPTGYYTISDGPHYIEVRVKKSSVLGATDGELQLYIDGVSKETLTTVKVFTRFALSGVKVGMHYAPASDITLFYDEIILRDDGTAIPPTYRRNISITSG
jgi:hypothetical protein